MSGHTPGPWKVMRDDSLDGCDFIPVETDQPTGPLCRLICEVRPSFEDGTGAITATDRANAALIAAAPDLLDALETHPGYAADVTFAAIWQWLEQCRSAIAKARASPSNPGETK